MGYSDYLIAWQLEAELRGLYASTLCEFFDSSSVDYALLLIDSIETANIHLLYKYEKGGEKGRSVGSSFDYTGAILIGGLELDLMFHYDNTGRLDFTANLKAANDVTTLGDIPTNILGDSDLDLPPFLADTIFNGDKDPGITMHLEVQKCNAGFHFLTNIVFEPIEVVFPVPLHQLAALDPIQATCQSWGSGAAIHSDAVYPNPVDRQLGPAF